MTRELRVFRGPRFRAADGASMPIHTDPGEEAQFDFCDLSSWAARWGWPTPLWCFGMILCWSRWRMWWFTTSEDREHTFEGICRFYDAVGGVPAVNRTDRMGALGRSQGARFVLHAPTVGFAAHHATAITSCKARDAKRKGKVERPFRQLRETFLPEVELDGIPADLAELNRRAERWLDRRVCTRSRHARLVNGPTHDWRSSGRSSAALPRVRFDTDYVETRRVHNIVPFVSVDGARYSVPPEVSGPARRGPPQGRRRPSSRSVGPASMSPRTELGAAGDVVWDPTHHAATEAIARSGGRVGRDGRHLRLVADTPRPGRAVVSR